MTKKKIVLALSSLLFSMPVWAQTQSSKKLSLPQAIQIALAKNQRAKANALRLEASKDQITASQLSAYTPSVQLGTSKDLQSSMNKSASISIGMLVFDSFAREYRLQAQRCEYDKQEARINSTDALSPNTNGKVASAIAGTFISLSATTSDLLLYQNMLKALQIIQAQAKSEKNKNDIAGRILNYTQAIQRIQSQYSISARDYQFITTEEVPTNFENLQETIESIDVPKDAQEAFAIALKKSPDIKMAELALKCDRLRSKAEKADAYGVKVSVSAGRSTDFNGHQNNSAHIIISKSFDFGMSSRLSSTSKNIEAAENDFDGTKADIENNLQNNYQSLRDSEKLNVSYNQILKQYEDKISSSISNITKLSEDKIEILLSDISTYNGMKMQNDMAIQSIIGLRISIQRDIGILFDSLAKRAAIN